MYLTDASTIEITIPAATDIHCSAHYIDYLSGSPYAPRQSNSAVISADEELTTTIISGPTAGISRAVKQIFIRNVGTESEVTVTHDNGTTAVEIYGGTLSAGTILQYTDDGGWSLIETDTESGGTVTQITSRTTGVTLNKTIGQITTDTTSLAAGASAKFTVTNSTITSLDTVILTIQSGTTTDKTVARVQSVANGSFTIVIDNTHSATAEVGAIILNFKRITGSIT